MTTLASKLNELQANKTSAKATSKKPTTSAQVKQVRKQLKEMAKALEMLNPNISVKSVNDYLQQEQDNQKATFEKANEKAFKTMTKAEIKKAYQEFYKQNPTIMSELIGAKISSYGNIELTRILENLRKSALNCSASQLLSLINQILKVCK